jgi:hypothetical protein
MGCGSSESDHGRPAAAGQLQLCELRGNAELGALGHRKRGEPKAPARPGASESARGSIREACLAKGLVFAA